VGVSLLALALLVWLGLTPRDGMDPPVTPPSPPVATPPPRADPLELAPVLSSSAWSPGDRDDNLPPLSEAEARLRHIRMRRAYPLWTQPLDPANVWTPPVPYRGSSSEMNPGARISVWPDRAQVGLGTPVRFFASAVDGAGHASPIERLEGFTAESWYGRTPHPRIALAFSDDGSHGDERAGDGIYTAVLALPADRANAGDWTVAVEGVIAGDRRGASTGVLVVPDDARFTGEFSEQVVDGSLVVHAGVEIVRPAFTHVRLELFAGEQPIAEAWLAYTPQAPGRQTVSVTFYGKVIRDQGVDGPYTIRHGVLSTGGDDGRFPGSVVDPVLTTKPYRAGSFTDRNKNDGNALLDEQERLAKEDLEAAQNGGLDPDKARLPRMTSLDKYRTAIPE
jgi:hypothetical protein